MASSGKTKTFDIEIDTDEVAIEDKVMTAEELLALVGKDDGNHYLVEIRGKRERFSYKDEPQAEVHLHPGSKFVTVSTGDTPVS